MAPFPAEQQKQQEAAAAAGYPQLPGLNPAVSPIAEPTGQQFYPAAAPPPYPSLAGPCSSTACAAPPPYQPYQPYPPQQYAAAPHAYPPAHAAGMAVTGYPAAAPVHHMQPMAVGPAPVQGSPAFINQQPCGCCTVGWVLFGVSAGVLADWMIAAAYKP
jgi:hypothetical protein